MGVTHRGRRQKQRRETREVRTKGPSEVRVLLTRRKKGFLGEAAFGLHLGKFPGETWGKGPPGRRQDRSKVTAQERGNVHLGAGSLLTWLPPVP